MFVLGAARAHADVRLADAPRYRASLSVGVAARNSDQVQAGVVPLHISGLSPTVVHLGGAYFFLDWLGAALDASFETYGIRGADLNGTQVNRQLFGLRLIAEAVGRWSPKPWFGLELHLGYGAGMWPGIALEGREVRTAPLGWHGPSVGFAVALEPDAPIGGQLFGRFMPGFGIGSRINPLSFSAGLQVHFLNIALTGEMRFALLVEGEVIGSGGGSSTGESFNQLQVRAALGARIRHQSPTPPPDVRGGATTGRIRGRVVAGGVGLSGATVSSASLPPATSGADGAFELDAVPAGTYVLKAVLAGYKPLEQTVDVKVGDEAQVDFELTRPTGPGRIRGVVKNDKGAAVADAEVTAAGRAAVKTAADGSYTVDGAGPGPVTVSVKAKGFKPAEDAAQVPPEGVATLDFALVPVGAGVPATIRGTVRAVSGKVVKATVKISDVNLTVPIKGDGRFVVQVPGGKYTLTIEAAGYVTQVKTVEVADGDQAIFQVDLQPNR